MAATHSSGSWNYAVPLEETNGNARPYRQHRAESSSDIDPKNLPKRSGAWDLMTDSETTKQRRTSLRNNNASQAVRKRSRNQLRDKRLEEKKGERVDDSAWIHRDKLAQIEIQEMQEAGIPLRRSRRSESAGPMQEDGSTSRPASRSASRSGARRSASRASRERQHDIHQDEDYTAAYPVEESPRKRVSTVPSAPEEEAVLEFEEATQHYQPVLTRPVIAHYTPDQQTPFDSSGGSGADSSQLSQKQQGARPGTSRIPVSRISPVPVPQNVVDRDLPLPRSRAGSQNWGGSFDEMQYARKARSGSMSSQVLLDSDADGMRHTPPGSSNKGSSNDENSPSKQRVPVKTTIAGPKTSIASTSIPRPGSSHQQNKGIVSMSAGKRPGSSSAHKSRPSTGHHVPDGEAPWMSSMYKPDPRLPPDQQMLPTHAKRLMQEQWEKEGKTGTSYDREFRLMNDNEFPKPKPPVLTLDSQSLEPPRRSPSPSKKDKPSPNGSVTSPWMVSPAKSEARSESSGRPGTSGGYRITPTIPQTPTMQRPPVPSPAPPQAMIAQNPTPRVPELDEKQEAKPKKGCCCVMM